MAQPKEPQVFQAVCPMCQAEHTFPTYQAQMRALIRWHAAVRNLIDKALHWPDWITND